MSAFYGWLSGMARNVVHRGGSLKSGVTARLAGPDGLRVLISLALEDARDTSSRESALKIIAEVPLGNGRTKTTDIVRISTRQLQAVLEGRIPAPTILSDLQGG